MYEARQNKEKVSRILPPLMRKYNQQICHTTKCIERNSEYLPKRNYPIQFVTEDYAKDEAKKKGLNYEKVVLPAIKTFLWKKIVVDNTLPISIQSLDENDYMLYLESLLAEVDNRRFKKVESGTWYRGIGFAHFSYPVFRDTGILCGEGFDNRYNWTMGEAFGTRWLPGATDEKICTCGPVSQIKYLAKYYKIGRNSNIIGIIVKKKLSKTNPALYADNPASECGIRGPQQVELAYLVDSGGKLISFSNIKKLPLPKEIY